MTTDQKLLISTVILPVLADMLEDVPMTRIAKMNQQSVIKSIRTFDRYFMNDTDIDIITQQNDLQLAFRAWCEEVFKEEKI